MIFFARLKRHQKLMVGAGLAVLLLLLMAAVVLLRPGAVEPSALSMNERLGLTVPAEVKADEAFDVVIDNIGSAAVELTIHGSYGLRRFSALGLDQKTIIRVPPADHAESGTVLLVARAGDRVGLAELVILPGLAVDPVESMLGPRTIVANASDNTMIVSVPVDVRGNPVARGTTVDWTLTRKGEVGGATTLTSTTDHLLAFTQIFATTSAGTSKLGPVVDGAHGREASFIEVPGAPILFALNVLDELPAADGTSLVRVRTDQLVDQFGNVMLDGTRVSVDITSTLGPNDAAPGREVTSRLWSVTNQGRAEFVIEVPARASSLQLVAYASGTAGEELTLDFAAAVTAIDLALSITDVGVLAKIGPVLTARDAFVPDGTEAIVIAIVDGEGTAIGDGSGTRPIPVAREETVVVIKQGVASLLLPAYTDRVQVEILGHAVTGTVSAPEPR